MSNRIIFKYELRPLGMTYLDLPDGFVILKIDSQKNKPVMWVHVDPKAQIKRQKFLVVLTGDKRPVDDIRAEDYRGTFQLYDQDFVGHVFYAGPAVKEEECSALL